MRTLASSRKSKRAEVEVLSDELPLSKAQPLPPTPAATAQRLRRRRRPWSGTRRGGGPALDASAISFLALAVGVSLLVARSARRIRPWALTRPSRRPFLVPSPSKAARALDGYRPIDATGAGVGDFSPRYAAIRYWIDRQLPAHPARTLARVRQLAAAHRRGGAAPTPYPFETEPSGATVLSAAGHHRPQPPQYDVFDCPGTPPPDYPFDWNLMRILGRWGVDDARVPERVHHSVCVFDFARDRRKILAYRGAEVPFVVAGDPDVLRAVERWHVPGYLEALIGPDRHACERSSSNHFLFYRSSQGQELSDGGNQSPSLRNPVETLLMSYREWIRLAGASGGGPVANDRPHTYFRLSAFGANPMKHLQSRQKQLLREQQLEQSEEDQDGAADGSQRHRQRYRQRQPPAVLHEPLAEYLFDELPFFQPRNHSGGKGSPYVVDPAGQHGIYCRFGMAGSRAASHFDLGRNAVALLRGRRRYVLSRPDQCKNLALFPRDHPSGRHSRVDWSRPDLRRFPEFGRASGNEVVLEAGQVLWLPSLYFHMIVSLDDTDFTVQCNTRSGDPPGAAETFRGCGF